MNLYLESHNLNVLTKKLPHMHAVMFDLWRTICRADQREPILVLQKLLGMPVSTDEEGQEVPDDRLMEVYLTTPTINVHAFLSIVVERVGVVVDDMDVLCQRFRREVLRCEKRTLSCYADTVPTLRFFDSLDVALGCITNTGSFSRWYVFEVTGLDLWFGKLIVSSSDVGSRKPDTFIYSVAVSPSFANCRPSEAMHIGDNLECDVVASLRAGYGVAVLVDREDRFSVQPGRDEDELVISPRRGRGKTFIVPAGRFVYVEDLDELRELASQALSTTRAVA